MGERVKSARVWVMGACGGDVQCTCAVRMCCVRAVPHLSLPLVAVLAEDRKGVEGVKGKVAVLALIVHARPHDGDGARAAAAAKKGKGVGEGSEA